MANLDTIRNESRYGRAEARNARTRPYRTSFAPKVREPMDLSIDVEGNARRRESNAIRSVEPTHKVKRTKRHGRVEEAKILHRNDDGTLTVLLKVWGMGERFTQKMRYSEWEAIA